MIAPARSRIADNAAPALAAGFAVVMIAIGISLLAIRFSTPWDGLQWQRSGWGNALSGSGWQVRPVGEVAQVEAGVAITAVNGQPITEIVRSPFDLTGLGSTPSLTYDIASAAGPSQVEQPLAPFPVGLFISDEWALVLTALGLVAVAGIVFARRPRDPAAQLLLVMASAFSGGPVWEWVGINDIVSGPILPLTYLAAPLTFLGYSAGILFPFVYPRPADWLVRHRLVVALLALSPGLLAVVGLVVAHLSGEPFLTWLMRLSPLEPATITAGVAIWLVGIPLRFRSLHGEDRRRYILLIGPPVAAGAAMMLVWILPAVILGRPLLPWSISESLIVPVMLGLAVAVLRLGVFESRKLLDRALVYGALTIAVASIYLALVGGTLLLVNEELGFLAAIVATVLAVLLIAPLREALQRAVNRLMYGDRDDPYRALSRLGARIEASLAPLDVLAAVVDTVAEALRVPYVAVEFETEAGSTIAAEHGAPSATVDRMPLAHQGELIGHLLVTQRNGDEMDETDRRLLADLARQASPAAFAARAQGELQRSRERLVAAREEERRRLRRDLHDGLGPALAGSRLQLQAAQESLASDPDRAQRILHQLEAETHEAIGEVRRMARDLRPPALDELGLLAALRERATHFSTAGRVRVEVQAPEQLPPLPAAVEVAAYRIALEALTNVVTHARARSCCLAIALDGDLRVEVRDDGVGVSPSPPSGIGLRSMRERANELGGSLEIRPGAPGTVVIARLPVSFG